MHSHQHQTNKLWTTPSKDFVLTVPIYESEVTKLGKKHHNRFMIFTEKNLVLFKNKTQPAHAILSLDFSTKFEIIRDAPELKPNAKKVAASGPRQDIVKPEDVAKLGEILLIRLSSEHSEKVWDFTTNQETLKRWRVLLGQKINQIGFHHMFKVFKKIGKGNFASVYLSERIEDGQQMAIKAFSKSAVYGEENGKEGLINEIQIMRELDHPNIMKLYEVFETQNSLYMGLELLQGGQLYEFIKKKVIFQTKEIQTIMKGLTAGVAYMHSKNIMHRDLKLENILFREANNISSVIIVDFGLATFVNEPVYLYCRCGTPGFVAPEVINITDMSTTYDSVCDVYSLGLVFHILLTGKPGFPGRSYNTIVQQNKEAKINFKTVGFEIVPPEAVELIKQMLEANPKKRITAKQALKSDYLRSEVITDDEGNIDEQDDKSDLNQRICKINEDAAKFDMLRINQLTNSPLKSPLMQATNRLKLVQDKDSNEQMIMRTPVITGRLQSCEESPVGNAFVSPSVQLKNRQQMGPSILDKYSKKPTQQIQQQQEQPQNKNIVNNVNSVKSALSKQV